jgi:prefoldin subunit 5
MIGGQNSFLENQVCILALIFSNFSETSKNTIATIKKRTNTSHKQHIPKSGGSVVKSSFVLLSKLVVSIDREVLQNRHLRVAANRLPAITKNYFSRHFNSKKNSACCDFFEAPYTNELKFDFQWKKKVDS